MKKQICVLFFVITCALNQSCTFNFNTFGSWKNHTISQSLRDEMGALNKKLYKGVKAKNIRQLKSFMSKPLLQQAGKGIDTIVNEMSELLKTTDYRVLDEFYIKSASDSSDNTVYSDKGNYNDYRIDYRALNRETYVSVMVSTNQDVNYMVLAIYGKYDDEWKLNILRFGEYSIMDQTAPEYYQSASYQFNKGNFVDASDLLLAASELAHPAGKGLSYLNEDEMKSLFNATAKVCDTLYHFPMTISKIKTKPQIFAIGPQLVTNIEPKGIMPMVKYRSSIPISDTVALKTENQSLQKIIGDLFHNIDKNKPGIIYKAYDKTPDGKSPYNTFTFLQHLKYGKSE